VKIETPDDAAAWMLKEWQRIVRERGIQNSALWRGEVLMHFREHGYAGLVYKNDNGSDAIDRKVLARFKKLTPNLVYDRYFDNWRQRADFEWQDGRGQW
jgi:hypothetical protein